MEAFAHCLAEEKRFQKGGSQTEEISEEEALKMLGIDLSKDDDDEDDDIKALGEEFDFSINKKEEDELGEEFDYSLNK